MYKTSCIWCNALIHVKVLPKANEVSVCRGTNCGELEMKFRAHYSDANIINWCNKTYGVDMQERIERCDLRKASSPNGKKDGM